MIIVQSISKIAQANLGSFGFYLFPLSKASPWTTRLLSPPLRCSLFSGWEGPNWISRPLRWPPAPRLPGVCSRAGHFRLQPQEDSRSDQVRRNYYAHHHREVGRCRRRDFCSNKWSSNLNKAPISFNEYNALELELTSYQTPFERSQLKLAKAYRNYYQM